MATVQRPYNIICYIQIVQMYAILIHILDGTYNIFLFNFRIYNYGVDGDVPPI